MVALNSRGRNWSAPRIQGDHELDPFIALFSGCGRLERAESLDVLPLRFLDRWLGKPYAAGDGEVVGIAVFVEVAAVDSARRDGNGTGIVGDR